MGETAPPADGPADAADAATADPRTGDQDGGDGAEASGTAFRADVVVDLKPGVTDAEGQNTEKALRLLGFDSVALVRAARHFHIELTADSADDARAQVERMCRRLLANPVVHDHTIEVREVEG